MLLTARASPAEFMYVGCRVVQSNRKAGAWGLAQGADAATGAITGPASRQLWHAVQRHMDQIEQRRETDAVCNEGYPCCMRQAAWERQRATYYGSEFGAWGEVLPGASFGSWCWGGGQTNNGCGRSLPQRSSLQLGGAALLLAFVLIVVHLPSNHMYIESSRGKPRSTSHCALNFRMNMERLAAHRHAGQLKKNGHANRVAA